MKSNSKAIGLLKGIGVALALPAVVLIVMELLVFTTQGTHVISSGLDVRILFGALAFRLRLRLHCNEHDKRKNGPFFGLTKNYRNDSGGVLAAQLGLGGIWIMIFAVVFGLGLGLS